MKDKKITVSSSKTENDKPENLLDQNRSTRWSAGKGEHSAIVEVDLETATAIGTSVITLPGNSWSQQVELQYWEKDEWKTIFKVQVTGSLKLEKFKPLTAQRFRLVVENKEAEPTLVDWQLYRPEK